jgi:hypothetical protein
MKEDRKVTPRIEAGHRDLDPDIFRKHAHEAADWIAGYLEDMNGYQVLAQQKVGRAVSELAREVKWFESHCEWLTVILLWES